MKSLFRFLVLTIASLALLAGRAQQPAVKPGYNIMLELSYDEQGAVEDAKIIESEDMTGDHALEQIVLKMAAQDKQPPRLVDGKPVKFKARRPFNYPVEGDEGAASNTNRPVLRSGAQARPAYPENLSVADQIGGAILELMIGADGTVHSVKTLRASHPEFGASAEAAVRQWTFVPQTGPGTPPESKWRVAIAFTRNGRNVDLKWRLAPRPSLGSFIVGQAPPATSPVQIQPAPAATPATPPAK